MNSLVKIEARTFFPVIVEKVVVVCNREKDVEECEKRHTKNFHDSG